MTIHDIATFLFQRDTLVNLVLGAVGFATLIVQHYEIKHLKRDLKESQRHALHAHNSIAFWQDIADNLKARYEQANALLIASDPLKLGTKPNSGDIARSRAARNAPNGTLGDAVKAARKDATGNEEPPTPKQGFA
jgi:hypothetical protein